MGVVNIVAVEGHFGLKPQGIAGPQPNRQEAERTALLQQAVPEGLSLLRGEIDLEPILARISGPRNEGVRLEHLPGLKPVIPNLTEIYRREFFENLRRLGALQGQQRGLIADVPDLDPPGDMVFDPLIVLFNIGRIDREHEVIIGYLVHREVIDERPVVVAEGRVLDLPKVESGGVAGHQPLDRREGLGAPKLDLAHVADVEKASRRADRPVLLQDA